jgi:hypothetical protein
MNHFILSNPPYAIDLHVSEAGRYQRTLVVTKAVVIHFSNGDFAAHRRKISSGGSKISLGSFPWPKSGVLLEHPALT